MVTNTTIALLLLITGVASALEQYTPDLADWSTFYKKAVDDNDRNTDHSPDGVGWISRDEWIPWDGTVYDPTKYSRAEFGQLMCPGNTVRGVYELFQEHKPFVDNVRPTKAEVDNWHALVLNHVRAMVNYTEPEYIIRPHKCLHIRSLWSDERKYTRKWDTEKYPGTCLGTTNPHCGAGFRPDYDDQQPYLPDDIDYCGATAGSEGMFSASSNIPWSIKWIRPFCSTVKSEGFWGGHTGPWFHRSLFGWSWWDSDKANPNSSAGLRTKWSGPSGTQKYEDPDVTNGRWKILVEGVDPNPRFLGIECAGINWFGGAANATQCYRMVMAKDDCGKRFVTHNQANGGCACYPTDMATCEILTRAARLTWDLHPRSNSFEGFLIDTTKELTGHSLPYSGRVCPQIIWKTGAGDASHCLEKIIMNKYEECGRNFMTFNAGGGCACYPPSQTTCTRAETSGQAGRQTYQIEVDPSYQGPTPVPSMQPSGLTEAPTNAPFSSSCVDAPMKMRIRGNAKSCSWVTKQQPERRCRLRKIRSHCPRSCAAFEFCSKDSEKKIQLVQNGRWTTCRWVARNKTSRRCMMPGVKETCRETCG